MKYRKVYENWVQYEPLDPSLKRELEQIRHDDKAIEDRFYQFLQFGTAGIRGMMGAGTNRINQYTIRKVVQGFSGYLLKKGNIAKQKGVIIAYDSRHQSADFAREAGRVLARNEIKVYLFDGIRPSPQLSFAVRYLGAMGGIMITASHNPAHDNGCKIYGEDGAQINNQIAAEIMQEIVHVPDELSVKVADFYWAKEQKLVQLIGDHVDEAYHDHLRSLTFQPKENNQDYKVVYTPLHGTGNKPVRRALSDLGLKQVVVVSQQEQPDPYFSTVVSPNPEQYEAFALAIQEANKCGADMIVGTDPDSDRVGVLVQNQLGEFIQLTGNQLGALLIDYILSQRHRKGDLPSNGVVIQSIVTSDFGNRVAAKYGVETIDTLTGFKYISEKIKELNESAEKTFLFGYEESLGYLIGDFCRDKDGIQASKIAVEMGAYYQKLGFTPYQRLRQLFEEFGYFQEDVVSVELKGMEGKQKIKQMMMQLRSNPPRVLAGLPAERIDYYEYFADSPDSNVLKFVLVDGSWVMIRPSGTESKIKLYFGVQGNSLAESQWKLNVLKRNMFESIGMNVE